jgi:UPF0755 protein
MDTIRQHPRWSAALACAVVLLVGYWYFLAPPSSFPSGSIVVVSRGASANDIVKQFTEAHIVKHASVFEMVLRISGASEQLQAGAYLFEQPENVLTVVYRLRSGESGLPPVRLTFPEGDTVRDMAEEIHEAFPSFSTEAFIAVAKSKEGYLFPDTYLFPSDTTLESIVETMRGNFHTKTEPLMGDVQASGHSLSDIITLASLVEKEARTEVNRRIVAGILWNRLAQKMPLQVDAVFGYIFNRDTYSPSFADLKVNSPYNTYAHAGLPPGPICNPGLESIDAALHPTQTKYLYYLTDREGVMHYATTYAEHQANQKKYLQ